MSMTIRILLIIMLSTAVAFAAGAHTGRGGSIHVAPAPPAAASSTSSSGNFVPTDPSEFRESLGLRPTADSPDTSAEPAPARREPSVVSVPVELPMNSYARPADDLDHNDDRLPRFALKINVLYGLGTLTPNFAVEFGLGKRTSLEVGGSYHPWRLKGSIDNNRKLVHMIIKPEFRYWLCERFNGHFFGVHALYGRYNIGTHDVPLLFRREYRYNGHAVGAGVTYGYNWAFHKRWGLEFAVGAGFMWMKYDRYDCAACTEASEPFTKWYFGPTNAAISLVFLIK